MLYKLLLASQGKLEIRIMIGSIRKVIPCEHLVSLGVEKRGRERSVGRVASSCLGVGVGVRSKERSIQGKEGRKGGTWGDVII